jgi:hypothetical protein
VAEALAAVPPGAKFERSVRAAGGAAIGDVHGRGGGGGGGGGDGATQRVVCPPAKTLATTAVAAEHMHQRIAAQAAAGDMTGIIHALLQMWPPDVRKELGHTLSLLGLTHVDQVREEGGVESLIQLMATNFSRVDVVKGVCTALANLALYTDENRARMMLAGGIEYVVRAMTAYGASADLIKSACGALANLAFGNSIDKVFFPGACGVCVHNLGGGARVEPALTFLFSFLPRTWLLAMCTRARCRGCLACARAGS